MARKRKERVKRKKRKTSSGGGLFGIFAFGSPYFFCSPLNRSTIIVVSIGTSQGMMAFRLNRTPLWKPTPPDVGLLAVPLRSAVRVMRSVVWISPMFPSRVT